MLNLFNTTKEISVCSTACRQDALIARARDKALALGVRIV